MRILGFSRKWGKLKKPEFTTFRFTRKDKDWQIGEIVQVVFKPRSKGREILGVAEIMGKEKRYMEHISNLEARRDGFKNVAEMIMWLTKSYAHDDRFLFEPFNKLTLRWIPESK